MKNPVTIESAFSFFRSSGWFSRIDPRLQDQLASHAKLRFYGAGEHIFNSGEKSRGLFGLVSGNYTITTPRDDGMSVAVFHMQPSSWLGDVGVFSDKPGLITMEVDREAWLVNVPMLDILKIVDDEPKFSMEFYRLTRENTHLALQALAGQQSTTSRNKIVLRLLLLEKQAGGNQQWLNVSQASIAVSLGISLPTVQRTVSKLAKNGLIELAYSNMRIIDQPGMIRLSQ